jgi:hypothetical protein
MESVLNLIFSVENARILVLLVFGFSCFVWFKFEFRGLKHDMCNSIEALTFTLEKNGYLKREDKEYIDRRLEK